MTGTEVRKKGLKTRWSKRRAHEAQSELLSELWEDPEFRQDCRDRAKAYWSDPEHRKHLSRCFKRAWTKKRHKEHSRRMRKRNAELLKDPKYRRRLQKNLLVGFKNREHREKTIRALTTWYKKRFKDPAFRRKWRKIRRKALKKQWNDAEFQKLMVESWKKCGSLQSSKAQRSVHRRLCRAGICGFKINYRVKVYSLDIANPLLMLCIEIDGPYWHDKVKGHKKRDRKRDRKLRRLGWKILRVRLKNDKVSDNQWIRILEFITEEA